MNRTLDIATSFAASLARVAAGMSVGRLGRRPDEPLALYEFESCPYCRKAREALTVLDLEAMIYPCPKGGPGYREELKRRSGKAQFPYLVDPDTGIEMYESLDIVAYLYETYGQRPLPIKWRLGRLQTFGSMLASAARVSRGMKARTGKLPKDMLELYSFESSPYARPVRELLCEMEIPYIVRSCGRSELQEWVLPPVREAFKILPESTLGNRKQLQEEEGNVSIPYLHDPNEDVGMFESKEILDYLQDTYAA